MKKIFTICLLFFSAGVFAQQHSWDGKGLRPNANNHLRNEAAPAEDSVPQKKGYESFFGKEKTEYSLGYGITQYVSDLDTSTTHGRESFPFIIKARDTVTLGKYVYFYSDDTIYPFLHDETDRRKRLYREDTLTGCLYELVCGEDTTEHILCNMSLNKGDTFRFPTFRDNPSFPNYHEGEDYKYHIADTIFYMQGRKVIHLKSEDIFWCPYFIEGIGCTHGPFGYFQGISLETTAPTLGCVHKDDSLVYIANERVGCVFSDVNNVPKCFSGNLHIYPNPAQDYLQVRQEDAADGNGEIVIVNALGMVMHHGCLVEGEASISLQRWASGIYTLLYRSQKSVQQVRFVKE